MNFGLLAAGVAAWVGVGALALLMAEWDEPVWGFFPILAAVLVAWAIGEYVTEVIWGAGRE
jgi:hypothetical protein